MKRFLQLYIIEQKLALRSGDMLIFGVAMPVGVMILINMIAGQKQAGAGFTYLDSSFASLIAVGICAAAFMGIPLTIADYRDKKILKHFFTTPCSPMWILGSDMLCAGGTALLSAMSVAFVSVVFLGYEMKGNVLAFMGSWLLTLVSMFSIGLLMASLCTDCVPSAYDRYWSALSFDGSGILHLIRWRSAAVKAGAVYGQLAYGHDLYFR